MIALARRIAGIVPRGAHVARATQVTLCLRNFFAASPLVPAIAAAAVFALSRPYSGIVGDARLYIGRGLADLDPTGIGRDVAFLNDGQSGFTIFPAVVDRLIMLVGPSGASQMLAAGGLAAWFAALVALARSIETDRGPWTIPLVVAVLPFFYGALHVFRFAEALAVPRPYAEALVLAAIAAVGSKRQACAVGLLMTATLFNPIMALAGLAVLLIVRIHDDRRWLVAGFGALGALVVATALGVPVASRLFARIDAEWLAVLEARNPYLFPHLWGLSALAPIVLQTVTILIATKYVDRHWRVILLAALAAGVAGLALAFIAGKWLPLVLVIQLQLWRLWWLTAVLAAVAFAIILPRLWNAGGAGRTTLALLTTAWATHDQVILAGVGSMGALYLHVRSNDKSFDPGSPIVACVFTVTLVPVMVLWVISINSLATILAVMPVDHNPGYARAIATFVQPLLILAVVLGWKLADRWRGLHRPFIVAASIALPLAALLFWDDRGPYERVLNRAERQTALEKTIPDRQGEILWLTANTEAWFWLGRPNWLSGVQGASIVFSRPLAMLFAERAKFLIDLDLAGEDVLKPWAHATAARYPTLTPDRLARVCQRSDAPIAIIAPTETEVGPLPGMKASIWTAPVSKVRDIIEGESVTFQQLKTYAVFDCSDYAMKTQS
jgi:hypothetical protein